MALFKISKGSASKLNNQPKTEGYCWFTTDDGKFYIDVDDNTRQILNAGHSDTTDKLKTARTISLIGDAIGSASFDGSENVEIEVVIGKNNGGLTEPIILTNEISYGNILPINPEEGQLFFLGEDSEELSSLPKGGSTGQYLVKKSDEDGDADWQTLNLPELNYLPLSGGKLSGSIHISHAVNDTMDNTTTNPRISFSENGTQEVALVYTDHNSYRSPAGLKVVGIGSEASPAWFEAEGNIYGAKVYGAVWNDYAEYRDQKEEIKPGYCVASANNGQVYKTTEKFQACDGIVSDTFGFAIGETDECKTPLAVAGRVLAYCEGDKYNYNAGDTVCAGPDGRVCKMTREEVREWPDRIIGIVSEIPEYDNWGTGNVKVDGRIWIKVK